jgi:hypothetical protein
MDSIAGFPVPQFLDGLPEVFQRLAVEDLDFSSGI